MQLNWWSPPMYRQNEPYDSDVLIQVHRDSLIQ